MKSVFCTILAIFLMLGVQAFAKIPVKQLEAEYEKCQKEKTSECFRILLSKSDNNLVRYSYAIALYNEKRFEEARRELSNFIYNDKNYPELTAQAKTLINNIDERYKSQVKASASDQGHYLGDLSGTVKWQNPSNIKVYIEPAQGKEALFRQALQTWDNRLMMINFSFINSPQDADIVCSYVGFIGKDVAGVTQATSFLVNRATGEKFFNPPVTIKISTQDPSSGRPFTDSELQSVILHEIGHALGMSGHSQNKNDIMFYSTETYKNSQISNRDVNTIKEIYK